MICPACRQQMPEHDLMVFPQTRTVARKGMAVTLAGMPFAMFQTLLRARPIGLSKERLMNSLYASCPDGGPDDGVITQYARILRRDLAPLDITVQSNRRGGRHSEYFLIIDKEGT